jgi:uncharacterized membrane protein YbaN (DUF454 family)
MGRRGINTHNHIESSLLTTASEVIEMRIIKRHFFSALGWVSFALGVIGAILPIMPTTPFLLLSSYFFSKGSPRFHAWLLNLKYVGPKIRSWEEHRVIDVKSKVLSTITLSAIILGYVFFTAHKVWVKALIAVALLATITFINTRKSRIEQSGSHSI